MHVGAISLAGHWLLKMDGNDLRKDNSPYHGQYPRGRHTIFVPVMYEDELIFICVCREHQADIGNSIPSTYHTKARDIDIYEEGAMVFPYVRVQCYKDEEDIIRMAIEEAR